MDLSRIQISGIIYHNLASSADNIHAGVMTSVTRFGVNGGGISGDTGEMISNNGFISDTDVPARGSNATLMSSNRVLFCVFHQIFFSWFPAVVSPLTRLTLVL